MRIKNKYLLLLILTCFTVAAFSQSDEDDSEKKKTVYTKDKFGLGVAGAANLSIFEAGYNARLYIPLAKRLNLVPEFYHFGNVHAFDANDLSINEFYLSLCLNFKIYQKKNITLYGNAGYVFTRWVNYDNVDGPGNFHGAQFTLGSEYKVKKISIFLEASTNTVYWELNTFLGVRTDLSLKFHSKHKNRHGNILGDGI